MTQPVASSHEDLIWLARSFGRTDYLLLSHDDLAAVADAGTYVTRHPGTHLFREGEAATAAYVIKHGVAELYRKREGQPCVVARVGSGSVIGDIAMFRGEPYLQSARAAEPVTALRLDRDLLIPLLLERPVVALRWLVSGLSQLERTQRRVVGLMRQSVLDRVAELLIAEADHRGEIQLSQAAIADLLSVSRQSVNEALGTLRRRGLITTGYGKIQLAIPDPGHGTTTADRSRPARPARSNA